MFASFYRFHLFTLVAIGCVAFVVLTLVAMLFYPGGTAVDATSKGYWFFENFFSDLGRTQSRNGVPNTIAAAFFLFALTMAGGGLGLFFIAFPQFFWRRWPSRFLSLIGSILGLGTAVCFMGVAFTPADLFLSAHIQFVLWAFRLFPPAVLCYVLAMFLEKNFPRRYTWYFLAFLVLLAAYYQLLLHGPDLNTYEGMVIQATGQKVIVYASVVSVLIQAIGARRGQFMLKNQR